jgi:beta-lactamase regulating signal transducer with metallopeptidase domain
MLVDWLYRTTLEVSLLIGLVLLVRPLVRRTLGARAAYWLWFIPLVRVVLIERPELPRTLAERVGVPGGELSIAIYPSPDVWVLPASVPWGALWLGGALLWIALRIVGAIKFRRLLANHSSCAELPPELSRLIPERLCRRGPRYFITDLPGTPFVTGLARPLVHLPTDFFQRFSPEEQKWVVEHELTHAARGDLWVQSLWEAVRAVFWFNPIVHLAANAVRVDQELACDQAVLGGSGNQERYSYGRALLVGAGAQLFPSMLSFFGNHKERIAMIRNHKASLARDLVGIALCALVGVFALTKAPATVAQVVSDEHLTMSFVDIEAQAVVRLIADFSRTSDVRGLEQLGSLRVNVKVQDVPARDALQRMLGCIGFTFREEGAVLAIVPLEPRPAVPTCTEGVQVTATDL